MLRSIYNIRTLCKSQRKDEQQISIQYMLTFCIGNDRTLKCVWKRDQELLGIVLITRNSFWMFWK